MRGRPATPSAPHSSMSTPSGKPDVFSRHRSAKSSGNVQVKVLSRRCRGRNHGNGFPHQRPDRQAKRLRNGRGKRERPARKRTGAAVRKRPPPARRPPCPPLRRSDSRSGNGATLSFHPSAGPEKARAEIRRRTGSGQEPPARAKGRPARTAGIRGRAAKPRGTGHGIEHNAEHPLHIEYGLGKGRHQSSPRTSVKKSTRVGSTGGGILPHPAGAFRFQRGEQFPIKGSA